MIVNPNQIRAARALLDWTVAQLGEKVGVGATMISAIETGRSSGSKDVLTSIIYAFQAAGVELTEDGGFIELFENETIKFKLTNLQSNKVYALDGIEGAFPTKEILRYERKVVSANVTSQDYDVRGYDLISLKKHEDIEEIDFRMDNGTTIKVTPFEMETESKAIDTFAFFKRISFADTDNETIEFQMPQHGIPDRIVFPLVGVNSITIRKNTGNDLDLHLRIDEGDYNQYGHKFAKN